MDKTLVSAGVKCYINGVDIGWVTGVSFHQSTPRRSVAGIDTLVPFELIAGPSAISGTVEVVRMRGDDSLENRGIIGGARNIIKEKYFTLQLVQHNATGAQWVLFRADQCSVESQSWEMRPKSYVQGSFQFQGIEALNASTQTETLP